MNLRQSVLLAGVRYLEQPQKDNAAFEGKPFVVVDQGYGHEISEHDSYEEAHKAMMARPRSKVIPRPKLDQTQENRDKHIAWSQLQNPDVEPEPGIDVEAGGPGSGCHGPNCGRPSVGYHGTTAPNAEGIAKEGIRRTSYSGKVYLTDTKESALAYAQMHVPDAERRSAAHKNLAIVVVKDPVGKGFGLSKRFGGEMVKKGELLPEHIHHVELYDRKAFERGTIGDPARMVKVGQYKVK